MAASPSASPEDYRAYVRRRLAELDEVFARAAIGDFSKDLTLPEAEDEFTELFAGIQIILEVIREKIEQLELSNEQLALRVKDLERLNRLMVGREIKMRELKQALAELKHKLNPET